MQSDKETDSGYNERCESVEVLWIRFSRIIQIEPIFQALITMLQSNVDNDTRKIQAKITLRSVLELSQACKVERFAKIVNG